MISIATKTVFLVGSNAAFLLPAIRAYKRGMFVEGTMYLTMGLVSAIYHICDTIPNIKKIIFDYRTWQFDDFYLSFNLIPVAALMIMFSTDKSQPEEVRIRNLNIKSVAWFITGVISVTLVKQGLNTPSMVFILGCVAAVIGAISMIFWRSSINLDVIDFVAMWVFIICGALCFFFCGNCSNYWIWHSNWHICAAIGIFFGIETENTTWNIIKCLTCGKYCNKIPSHAPPGIPIYM
jgi:hypothetical protein